MSIEDGRLIIKCDGSYESFPPGGQFYTLPELQKVVGGYIQILAMRGRLCMVINEEGKLAGLPYNARATAVWLLYTANPVINGDYIVGDVLIARLEDID